MWMRKCMYAERDKRIDGEEIRMFRRFGLLAVLSLARIRKLVERNMWRQICCKVRRAPEECR